MQTRQHSACLICLHEKSSRVYDLILFPDLHSCVTSSVVPDGAVTDVTDVTQATLNCLKGNERKTTQPHASELLVAAGQSCSFHTPR